MEGYHHGVLLHAEIQDVCDVWLAHTLGEMVSSSSKASTSSTAYEVALHGIVDVMLPLIHEEFRRSVDAGAIPRAMVDEMEGIVAGVRAMGLRSSVTLAHIVALNYGIDFVLRGVYMNTSDNVETCELVKLVKSKLSASALRVLKATARVPDMCNTAMVGKWMLRDYSFTNGLSFHKYALVVVRQREGTMSVAMPGMVGAITAMSSRGVVVAVNLVRSTHVSSSVIGLNSVLMVRHLVTSENVLAAEERLNAAVVGVPWLYSVMDRSDRAVFETVVASVDMYPTPLISKDERASMRKNATGVYTRRDDGEFVDMDAAYNAEHVRSSHPSFASAEQENAFKGMYGAGYFQPPTADAADEVLVVANDFRLREPRMTQRGDWIRRLQLTASRPQWRYEEMVRLIASAGTMDLDAAKRIAGFSVWTRHDVIQGFLGVFDTETLTAHLKIGHVRNEWIRLDLSELLKMK
jgi:hypothetical protein